MLVSELLEWMDRNGEISPGAPFYRYLVMENEPTTTASNPTTNMAPGRSTRA